MAERKIDMYSIIILIFFIIACIKWGNLKNWKEYYSTILYYIVADSTYDILFYNKMLWEYPHHGFSDGFVTFIVFPCIIILFLTYFPAEFRKTVLYIFGWAILSTLIEYFAFVTGSITYHFGWNIFCSFLFLFVMFIMIGLHYKKPLLTWPISVILGLSMLFLFEVPLSSIK